jgi:large subunit ribosomal protein L29
MAKTDELREMSDEQIRLTWKDAAEHLFRLRIQAQTERLDAPSELRRQRRLIARCQTVLNERRRASTKTAAAPTATAAKK